MDVEKLFGVPLQDLMNAIPEIFSGHCQPVHRREFLFFLRRTLSVEGREFKYCELQETFNKLLAELKKDGHASTLSSEDKNETMLILCQLVLLHGKLA